MRMTKNWTSKSDSKGNHHVLGEKDQTRGKVMIKLELSPDDPALAKIFVLAVDNSELKYTMILTLFPSFLHYFL
jgi:hypothetical protein